MAALKGEAEGADTEGRWRRCAVHTADARVRLGQTEGIGEDSREERRKRRVKGWGEEEGSGCTCSGQVESAVCTADGASGLLQCVGDDEVLRVRRCAVA